MKALQTLRLKKRLIIFFTLILAVALTIGAELNLRYPHEMNLYSGERLYAREGLPYTLEIPANIGGVLLDDGKVKRDTSLLENDYSAKLKLFGIIPVKTVNVNVLEEKSLTVSGKTIGIKMFTEGLLAVGISDITDINGKSHNLGNLYGIKTGDIILSANDKTLFNTEDLADAIENSKDSINLTIKRGDKTFQKEVYPIETKDGLKLGIWVRDSTAGIGTLTFLDGDTLSFGALGHPIADSDTGVLMPVSSGTICDASVVGVNKGEAGIPGELRGVFKGEKSLIGEIEKNTEQGIFGKITDSCKYLNGESFPICSRNGISEGKAQILSNIDGEKIECFDIEIERVMRYNIDNYKDLVIKVTDNKLLEQTGGIVQGMSGSPILQNGRIVGAVTHVFVNDPTRGYGIFIENMLTKVEN
ncbi:MAG: SpoIVB peptidase [Clostridia bacterium]|nr:SpoIVB peptidase [Clostridia bacterium]